MVACISAGSRLLAPLPKGCSSSVAVQFRAQKVKTCRKENTAANTGDGVHCTVISGVSIQCNTRRKLQICAYGNGKAISAIFSASCNATIPVANSWKTLERIGGGI